jgi:AcrR family transcriptional regulator
VTPRSYQSPARRAAAEQTRQRILRAAKDLFATDKPFSLEAVAKRARVTRVTIYHQFESKAQLLEAVFDEFAAAGGLIAELPKLFADPDPRRALRRMVHVFVSFYVNHRRMLPRLSAAIVDADIAQAVQERSERRRKVLATIVRRLVRAGVESARVADLVDMLFALTSYEMFELLSIRERGVAEIEVLVARAVDAVLEFSGLLA